MAEKMKPCLTERTYRYGKQLWRIDENGTWKVYMWGWWPDSNGNPSGRFQPIDTSKVPPEILAMAGR